MENQQQSTDLGTPHPDSPNSSTSPATDRPIDSAAKPSTPTAVDNAPAGTDVSSRVSPLSPPPDKPFEELSTDEKLNRLMTMVANGVPVATPTPTPAQIPPAVQPTIAPAVPMPGNPSTQAAAPYAIPQGARFDPMTGEPLATSTTPGGGIHPSAAMVDPFQDWTDMDTDAKLESLVYAVRELVIRNRVP